MKFGGGDEEYWRRIGDAMEASHCLSSMHVCLKEGSWLHDLSTVLTGLCRKEGLTEFTIIDTWNVPYVLRDGFGGTYVLSL